MGQFLQDGENACFVSFFFWKVEPSCYKTWYSRVYFSIVSSKLGLVHQKITSWPSVMILWNLWNYTRGTFACMYETIAECGTKSFWYQGSHFSKKNFLANSSRKQENWFRLTKKLVLAKTALETRSRQLRPTGRVKGLKLVGYHLPPHSASIATDCYS